MWGSVERVVDDIDGLLEAVQHAGPYAAYVEGPIREGIGAGLVRRHDALMNWIRRRMAVGVTDSMADTSARINLFRGLYAERGVVRESRLAHLLDLPAMRRAAEEVVGAPVTPLMVYPNFLLPGQELAVHTDTPEFVGLDKADCPEWLLVVMYHSGLFEDWRLQVAGGVMFFHPCVGGAFVLYPEGPNGEAVRFELGHGNAVVLDPDVVFHGVERVGGSAASPPPVEPGMALAWTGDEWSVGFPDQAPVARYRWGELRFSIQWKGTAGRVRPEGDVEPLTIERALLALRSDLLLRGVDPSGLDNTDLAVALIETNVRFPDNDVVVCSS